METAIRSALHPLAKDLESDVLEFIVDTCKGADENDTVDMLCSLVPGFSDQPKNTQRAKAKAVALGLKQNTGAPAHTVGVVGQMDSLAAQVAAASLGGAGGTVSPRVRAGAAAGAGSVSGNSDPPKKPAVPAALRPHVSSLQALLPHISDSEAVLALQKCALSVEAAAGFCLEHDVTALVQEEEEKERGRVKAQEVARAQEARAEAEAKKRVLERYDERPDDHGRVHAPGLPAGMGQGEGRKKGEKVLAFVDGQPVYVRPGEKYVVESKPEFPQGPTVGQQFAAQPIKVKKKGQGGASPGFR